MVRSAGILVYRDREVFLVRSAGPFDRGKDRWVIPKGQLQDEETPWEAAIREWQEETGDTVVSFEYIDLGEVRRNSKSVHIYAIQQEARWKGSNRFEHTFKNGSKAMFYETDAGGWFSFEEAADRLPKNQKDFIGRLERRTQQRHRRDS